jgi:hypothetical protein
MTTSGYSSGIDLIRSGQMLGTDIVAGPPFWFNYYVAVLAVAFVLVLVARLVRHRLNFRGWRRLALATFSIWIIFNLYVLPVLIEQMWTFR